MTTVLLFAEHELTRPEVTRTLEALAGLRADGDGQVDVTVLVPYPAHWPVELMLDVATARGMSASRALGESRHESSVARASAERILQHVLSALRGGGHRVRGELVAVRDAVRDLATEAAARRVTTALVVTSPHRVSHLLHRDLEHRLQHAGVHRVVRLQAEAATGATATARS